ncbi:hypothetical protein MSPP1_000065 [Malassezia sp. CBS 17886]|nr:hypothetical protein MSPP1_000065 [Malassezia sp. CBS 17886]
MRPTGGDEGCAWAAAEETRTVMLDPDIAATKVQPHVGMPYQFDGVHTGSTNADIYAELARPLVQALLQGYDAVIFAYGQTASGKTFTLSGDESGQEPGIIVRSVCDVFHGICQASAQREYLLRVSYLEIWNEVVRDLLDPGNQPQVRDGRRRGAHVVVVAPLHEEVVTSPRQVFDLLMRGEANRQVGATDWNERSSRSHTCFKITVESWERDAGPVGRHYRISELSLIDLAGSERHTRPGVGRRMEGANINKSLLSLGKVIYALAERSAAEALTQRTAPVHVPYRDSKLTRILQNSLNGNARIAVVCTLNPSPAMVDESLGTLNFARRIKNVAVRATQNEFDEDVALQGADGAHALLARYRREMGLLRAKVEELQEARSGGVGDARRPHHGGLPAGGACARALPAGGASHRAPSPRSPSDATRAPDTRCASPHGAPDRAADACGTLPKSTSAHRDMAALQARLDQLGTLILRGGEDTDTTPAPHPVSPAKQRGFAFEDPLPLVQEKLHAALTKISRLERQLARRLSTPGARTDADKDRIVAELLQRIRELETVCEAQVLDAPQQVRDDVEREWSARLADAQRCVDERDAFIEELGVECAQLRRTNECLVRLAHDHTSALVANLWQRTAPPSQRTDPAAGAAPGTSPADAPKAASAAPSPARPLVPLFAPRLRPTTVLGYGGTLLGSPPRCLRGAAESSGAVRSSGASSAERGDCGPGDAPSLDDMSMATSDALSSSDLDELLEDAASRERRGGDGEDPGPGTAAAGRGAKSR